MRTAVRGCLLVALLLLGVRIGVAYDRDQTTINVQVSSSDHEVQEGYFALGEQATVMVKPGSDLFKFLSRNRGQKVRIVLTQHQAAELSRIER